MVEPKTAGIIGDISIRRVGVGCARFTGDGCWGPPKDRAECVRVLRRAVELGVNIFDTADVYGPHASEEVLREALHPYPDDVIIGTKIGVLHERFGPPGSGIWPPHGRPEYLRYALEMSLRRLGIDQVPLVHLHISDPNVPYADQVGTLLELQLAGKIGRIGLSNVTLEQLEIGQGIAEIASVENRFSVLDHAEAAVLDRCGELGVVFLAHTPLGRGALLDPQSPVRAIAGRAGLTPAQFALAWLLHRSPVMVPIPGPVTVGELEEDLATIDIELSDEMFDEGTKAGQANQ